MTSQQEVLKRMDEAATNAEHATEAYNEVLTSDGEKDIQLVDGSTTPNLNKRLSSLAKAVASVNGRTGNIELTPEDIGYPSLEMMDRRQKEARFVIDKSGLTQQEINNILKNHNVKFFGAIGDGVADDTDSIQNAINSIVSTSWVGSVENQSYTMGFGEVYFPVGKYKITRPLLVGGGITLRFESPGGYNFDINKSAVLIPDFTNPLQWAIQSATYGTDGNLVAYDRFVTGEEFDNLDFSNCHRVKIINPNIVPLAQIYGGIKLTGCPQSIIDNPYIDNTDYGIALSSSWASVVNNGITTHNKCGVLSLLSNHNLQVNGYYDKKSASINPLAGGTNLINHGEVLWNEAVGVYFGAGHSSSSTNLTVEGNSYGIVAWYCPVTLQSLYTEVNKKASILAANSAVNINLTSGVGDNKLAEIYASELNIYVYNQGVLPSPPSVNSGSSVFIGGGNISQYWDGVKYGENNNVVYVDSVNGNDSNTGYTTSKKCKTISSALKRSADKLVLSNGTYTVDNEVVVNRDIHILGTSNTSTIVNIINSFRQLNSSIYIENSQVNCSNQYGSLTTSVGGFNALKSYNSNISLVDQSYVVAIDQNSEQHTSLQLIKSSVTGLEFSKIIYGGNTAGKAHSSEVILTGTTVSSLIVNQSDKGLDISRDQAIGIVPVLFK